MRLLIDDVLDLLAVDRRTELAEVWADVDDALLAAHLTNGLLPRWPKAGHESLVTWVRAIREHLSVATT